jgi:hypothetical protein
MPRGAAQRRYGAVDAAYDEACLFDNDRIDAIAAEIETALGRELPELVPSVKGAVEKFVAAKWSDIEFIARALGKLETLTSRRPMRWPPSSDQRKRGSDRAMRR